MSKVKSPQNIKQVIVMREKFPDGKGGTFTPRKGKMIAQGAHASLAFLTRRIENVRNGVRNEAHFFDYEDFSIGKGLDLTYEQQQWLFDGIFAKICLKVSTLEELEEIAKKATEAGLEVHVVTDRGLTEFKEPTITCLAIGPDLAERIDPVTGHLSLL
jgi:PTH2 family peptidyl-tRNA hydrolase